MRKKDFKILFDSLKTREEYLEEYSDILIKSSLSMKKGNNELTLEEADKLDEYKCRLAEIYILLTVLKENDKHDKKV